MLNYFKKSILALSFILLFFPVGAQAAITKTELQNQLNAVSLMLVDLSTELQGYKSISVIQSEINQISSILASLVSEASILFPSSQGQVLGVTVSGTALPKKRPLAEVDISPSSSSSSLRGGQQRTILSFDIEPAFSDIWVNSIEVVFDREIWQYIEWIVLKSGGRNLSVLGDPEEEDFGKIGDDDAYKIRFSGFLEKVDEGRSTNFRIRIRAKESNSFSGVTVKTYLRDGAVRFVDEADFNQQVPFSSGDERGRFVNVFQISGN